MATVRHLGLFPRNFLCPSENFFGQEIPRQYPDIWMPPEYALAMYWRVKKWRFSYSNAWAEISNTFWQYSSSAEFFVGQYRQFTQTGFPPEDGIRTLEDYTFGEPPATETKLVCGVDLIEGEVLVEQDFEEPTLEPVTFENHFNCIVNIISLQSTDGGSGTGMLGETNSWGPHAAFYRNGSNGLEFRPGIRFFMRTFRWVSIYASNWTSTVQPPSGPYGTFSYKLLGQTFSTDIYAYNSRGGTTLNVTADLEALEYWPYDPGDGGGPIYDSATGAQLRPFPA
jgi:hypothetical protein